MDRPVFVVSSACQPLHKCFQHCMIFPTCSALEAKEIPQGRLTSHACSLALTLLEMAMSGTMNHRIQKFKMEGDLLKIFGIGDGLEASHLTQSTALCISSYNAILCG